MCIKLLRKKTKLLLVTSPTGQVVKVTIACVVIDCIARLTAGTISMWESRTIFIVSMGAENDLQYCFQDCLIAPDTAHHKLEQLHNQ